MRKILIWFVLFLGLVSFCFSLFDLFAGNDWERSLMWFSLGVLLSLEFRAQRNQERYLDNQA